MNLRAMNLRTLVLLLCLCWLGAAACTATPINLPFLDGAQPQKDAATQGDASKQHDSGVASDAKVYSDKPVLPINDAAAADALHDALGDGPNETSPNETSPNETSPTEAGKKESSL